MNGLVVCGGKSTRMGLDKSLITYHELPQRLHLQNLLKAFSKSVLISLNDTQKTNNTMDKDYLLDDPEFLNIGPMAALLTYFRQYPNDGILVLGCDYPLITIAEIENFILTTKRNRLAAAFYNQNRFYEPLLAWYSPACFSELMKMFRTGDFSLQSFLNQNNAEKYFPTNEMSMFSADTPAEAEIINKIISKKS